ncbi:calcium-activated chloride channel regulator 1-like [Anneissia japonica]|uniref:calcium-activated chloride channel regulator 1-like n=1 Tax=Anneissia japonica TaxID=1529436 RepID=UPI001425A328|nr:calcium-activated chloride channel regulator 1-like [Anneissia japonica]
MAVVRFICIAFFAFSLFFLASGNRNQIALKDGGYENLLIAITKEEKEDKGLIDNIKEIFTDGSSFLFKATGRRVYWKTITILVPQSWPHLAEYEPAKTETFDRTNVRIAKGESPSPYARLTEGCGKQGQYINLTPQYVRDKTYAVKGWGPRDKLIVHEWAHFRWGVFDEYPYENDDKFVVSKKKIEATRCTKSVSGVYRDYSRSDRKCQLDPKTGVYTKSCKFEDDNSQTQRAETSIMYKQFLPSINFFCNGNEVNPDKRHFAEAPNRHNRLCKGKSIWDVMLGTDDFKNSNNPPRTVSTTTPTFRIVQATTARRVVLVLDTSGSMEGDPLMKLRQATTHYLESTIYIGSYVAIVGFSSSAYQLAPLTLVADDNSRARLTGALPSNANGRTSIASGVRMGIQILSSNGQSSNGGYLLVVSDGKDTSVPSVFDEVVSSGVIIDTIAITEDADNILSELSSISGGRTSFYSGSDSITVLIDSLTATITDRPDQTNEALAITIYSEALTIDDTSDTATSDCFIDTAVGVDTIFFFAWLDNPIQVVLHSPDGHIFNKTSVEYNLNSADEIITIRINGRAVVMSNHVDVAIDRLQPSRIIDLKVIEVSYQQQSVTLQWTAVGDDFDKGSATEYDLRFAETFEEIFTNFSSANLLTQDDVISGNLLMIKQSGLLEEVKVRLPKRGAEVSYYFGVMAIDEANNTGGLSNIVSANLEYIPPLEQDSNGINVLVLIVVAIGVAGFLMFTLIGLYIKHTRRSTTGSNDRGPAHVNPAYA